MSFYSVNLTPDALSMDTEELERNRQLIEVIHQSIKASQKKAISFAKFMEFALYHPDYGYYTSATQILGREGDFTTAPELGSVFGKILAKKLANLFKSNKMPHRIYEFGAGSGILGVQILTELNRLGCHVDEYVIIELSPRLKQIQKQRFSSPEPELSTKIHWLDAFPAGGIKGVVIVNEVLDAMPVELFRVDEKNVSQGYVVDSREGLQIEYSKELEPEFKVSFSQLGLPEMTGGYISELHCQAQAWLRRLADSLDTGVILIADYGFPQHEYYHMDRCEGTLMCHRRHHSLQDPFAYIGCQDITAHLNFSGLASVAEASGLQVSGFTTLAGFIVGIGFEDLDLSTPKDLNQRSFAQQLNTLTSPAEMGELFKVMELSKNVEPDNFGFATLDQLHRL